MYMSRIDPALVKNTLDDSFFLSSNKLNGDMKEREREEKKRDENNMYNKTYNGREEEIMNFFNDNKDKPDGYKMIVQNKDLKENQWYYMFTENRQNLQKIMLEKCRAQDICVIKDSKGRKFDMNKYRLVGPFWYRTGYTQFSKISANQFLGGKKLKNIRKTRKTKNIKKTRKTRNIKKTRKTRNIKKK